MRDWAFEVGPEHPRVRRIGYFGSYVRGTWGVGSDVDLVVILDSSSETFDRRSIAFDTHRLPVPADLFVYTLEEWNRMVAQGGLPRSVAPDIVWLYGTEP